MASVLTIRVGLIDVRTVVKRTSSGQRFLQMQCAAKGCPLHCGSVLTIPMAFSFASVEPFVRASFTHCPELVKFTQSGSLAGLTSR